MQSPINNYNYYDSDNPSALIVFICGNEEADMLKNIKYSVEQACSVSLSLLAYTVEDWNRELSPWPAPPVFGKEAFGGLAKDTLNCLEKTIRCVTQTYIKQSNIPVILGGYSLAGLFALWAAYQTDIFNGISAVSPSVWFQDWIEYASSHIIHTDYVYLSLGDKESRTRNTIMSKVYDCIKKEHEDLISSGQVKESILELNPGNHFQNVDTRVLKALQWVVNKCLNKTN